MALVCDDILILVCLVYFHLLRLLGYPILGRWYRHGAPSPSGRGGALVHTMILSRWGFSRFLVIVSFHTPGFRGRSRPLGSYVPTILYSCQVAPMAHMTTRSKCVDRANSLCTNCIALHGDLRLYIWLLTSWGAARLARLPSPGPALCRSPGLGLVAFSVLFRLVRGIASLRRSSG